MEKRFREQMKNNRGYGDMIVLTKFSNLVNSLGGTLVQIAIMAYLHDPSLEMEDLVEIAYQNSPMSITKDDAEEAMKDALINILTHDSEKLLDDGVLKIYIRNIASEVRISEMLRVKSELEGLELDNSLIGKISRVTIRCMMKSDETFEQALRHVAWREGYDDFREFTIILCEALFQKDLKQIVDEEVMRWTKETGNSKIGEIEKKKEELLMPYVQKFEDFVNLLIQEHENLQF